MTKTAISLSKKVDTNTADDLATRSDNVTAAMLLL